MSIRYCTRMLAPFAGTPLGDEVRPEDLKDLDLHLIFSLPVCPTLRVEDAEQIKAGDRLTWVPSSYRVVELHWGEAGRNIAGYQWWPPEEMWRAVGDGAGCRLYVWSPPTSDSWGLTVLIVGEPIRTSWDLVWERAAEEAAAKLPLWQPEKVRNYAPWQKSNAHWQFERERDQMLADRYRGCCTLWDSLLRRMDAIEADLDGLPDVPDGEKQAAAAEWDERQEKWRWARRWDAARAFRALGRQKISADDFPFDPPPNRRRGRKPRWAREYEREQKAAWRTWTPGAMTLREIDEAIPF